MFGGYVLYMTMSQHVGTDITICAGLLAVLLGTVALGLGRIIDLARPKPVKAKPDNEVSVEEWNRMQQQKKAGA
jgi:hypothetical protein